MAEHVEEPEAEASAGGVAPPGGGAVAAAIALALGKVKPGNKLPQEAAEFLKKQSRLADLQMEHLHEQRELALSRLRWGRFSDRMKAALQVLTVLVGLAIAVAVGAMAWRAHQDHGVVIEAFSVAPDMAQRGMSGQVVAGQLLDKLARFQAKTVTGRPPSTYANDWGGDIKVEIPETGVSVGELNRYLREWLGHETRISGDVVRTPTGLAVTARAGANPGATFEGSDADLDGLMQKAAEAIYEQTQPYRYAVYLASIGRRDEALSAYQRIALSGEREDRPWAYAGWGTLLIQRLDAREALAKASKAIELDPRIDAAYPIVALSYNMLGRQEDNLKASRAQLRMLESGSAKGVDPEATKLMADYIRHTAVGFRTGDYADAVATLQRMPDTFDFEGGAGAYSFRGDLAALLIGLHDVSAGRRVMSNLRAGAFFDPMLLLVETEDWAAIAASRTPANLPAAVAKRAFALGRLGRIADAEASLATTTPDCTDCITVRGAVRAMAGDRQGADRWFSEAATRSDELPFAHLRWATALLWLGDPDAAIAKLQIANQRSPRFADPLELWGEALMRKGDLAGAIAKFAEADQDAPRWGRNHLRWGEALMLAGRYAEARAQYEAANGLDLSRPDRAALDVLLARTAKGPLHG